MKIDVSHIKEQKSSSKEPRSNKRSSLLTRDIKLPGLTNSTRLKGRIFQELSVLLSSGLDIITSLGIIEGGLKREKDKKIVNQIMSSLIEGSTLSEAAKSTKIFEPFDYYSLKIGEQTSKLVSITKELASFYSKKITQQRQLRSAIAYPGLVLTTTVLSLGFMLRVIVPMFEDIFKRFQGELPTLTKGIIKLSDSASKYSWIILLLIAIITILIVINRKRETFRKISSKIILKIPIINKITLLNYKVRYCQTLTLLTASKIPLIEAIDLIKEMIVFYPLEKALFNIKKDLLAGKSLSTSMKQHKIFDNRMISLTEVAEEVNNLEIVYNQLYDQYSEELDVKIKTLNALLEPVLIIVVGGMVAIMLIAMYMPIFQIGIGLQ